MKYFFLIWILLFNSCDAGNMMTEDTVVIRNNHINIKYINFKPKQVDKTCLDQKIDKLVTIIKNQRKARNMEHQIPHNEYFSDKYKKEREEIKSLSGELLQQKHISSKGNFEWRELVNSKHIIIEDQKENIYIMYPLDPSRLIMSNVPFEKIAEGESIDVRGLKHWINMKECMKS